MTTTSTAAAAATTTPSSSHRHPHASVTLFTAAIFQFPTSVSQLQACARTGRNAGSILKIKDGSPRNDSDSRSSSTSGGNVPCPADTHHSHGRNRDKTVFTASGVDSPSLPSTSCKPPALSLMSQRRVFNRQPSCYSSRRLEMRRRGAVPSFSPMSSAPPQLRPRSRQHLRRRSHPPRARFDNNNTDASVANTGTSDSSSNNAANIPRTINAYIATNNNGDTDNTASFVDTACTLNANASESRTAF